MTSDAKIGLLLGLVFIFIIAFVINGLPSFRTKVSNNELTINGTRNNPPAFGAKEREIINQTELIEKQITARVQNPQNNSRDVRYTSSLPENNLVAKQTDVTKPTPIQPSPTVKEKNISEVNPSKPTLPRIYVVKEGDSLASIAKNFYGSEEGNKKLNIERIFKVNRKVLKSPDAIYPEQKLIIPPLTAYRHDKDKVKSVFSTAMFKKAESIGQRHLPADNRRTKQGRLYIVRENDNLWRIATEQLGNGKRYTEIVKMNSDVIDDEDNLPVGTRLKLPAR